MFRPVRSSSAPWTLWVVCVVSTALIFIAFMQARNSSDGSSAWWPMVGVLFFIFGLVALLIVYPRVMAYRADAQGMHIRGLLGWFTVARADIVKVTLEDVHLVWRTFATGAPGLFYGHFVEKHLQNVRAYSSINKGEMVVIYTRTRKPVLISPEAAQAFSSTLERLGYPLSH